MISEDAIARQYHSITIGQYNTWKDFRLIPTSRPVVAPPEVRTNFVDVPGADGSLDFTEALDEMIHFKNREGEWEFYVCHEKLDEDTNGAYSRQQQWAMNFSYLMNVIHGRRNSIILMDEWAEGGGNNRLYVGRTFVDGLKSDPSHSIITISYILLPHRYLSEEDANTRTNGVL